MATRKLHRDGDFIIVDTGSEKEAALLADGWTAEPKKAAKTKAQGGKAAKEPESAPSGETNKDPEAAPENRQAPENSSGVPTAAD